MTVVLRRCFVILLFSLEIASAAESDPVGYMTLDFVAGKKGSLAVPLATDYRMFGAVSAAGTDYVEFATDLPPDQLGVAQSACLDIRSGPGAGQSLRVTGISGRRVNFESPAVMPITAGTMAGLRPNWSLGELLGSPPFAIEQGTSHESADVIGLQDPATQSTREFFYKSGSGWREVGREAEGDRAATAIPFRSALQFFRRGATDLKIVVFGSVPMFSSPNHWIRVWPGRNLLTTPFSPATKIKDFIDVSSLTSGLSAPRSDTLRLVYLDASLSNLIFHHQIRGWTTVSQEVEYDDQGQLVAAENTRVEISQVMDFQRNGGGGYLKFKAFTRTSGFARALAVVEEVLPVEVALSDFAARKIGWRSNAGTAYQVQTQTLGSGVWIDHGSPVVASGDVCQKVCSPDGSGIFRVVAR